MQDSFSVNVAYKGTIEWTKTWILFAVWVRRQCWRILLGCLPLFFQFVMSWVCQDGRSLGCRLAVQGRGIELEVGAAPLLVSTVCSIAECAVTLF